MGTARKAFYTSIEPEGSKPHAVGDGIRWLAKQGQEALVVVATLDNLTLLESSLASERVRAMKASESVSLGANVRLTAATDRKMVSEWFGPVLVLYPTKALLDKVDSIVGVTSVLVVPWTKADMQAWIATWKAEEFGAAKTSPAAAPAPTPAASLKPSDRAVLEAALKSLTNRVNISTGLGHPGDKASAIDLFTILRGAGVQCESEEVKSLLLSRFNWGARQANEVSDLLVDLQAGKRPRKHRGYESPSWNPNILQTWREEAQAAPSGSSAVT